MKFALLALRAAIVSMEFLFLILILLSFTFLIDVYQMIGEKLTATPAAETFSLAPCALVLFALGITKKLKKQEDKAVRKTFYEWPDYLEFEATVNAGLYLCIISSLVIALLFLFQEDVTPAQYGAAYIACFGVLAISSMSLNQAEDELDRILAIYNSDTNSE